MNKKVILILADISGYTRYMASTRMELEHGQMILNALTTALIEELKPPLEIAKLEGDAVFMYALKDGDDSEQEAAGRDIWDNLIRLFDVFYRKAGQISGATNCECNACKSVSSLRLKVAAHSGEAHFYELGKFEELSGVDVIIAHRLLKNSVEADHYILMTEPAFNDLATHQEVDVTEGEEKYDAIGALKTYAYFPQTRPEFILDIKGGAEDTVPHK